MLIKNELFFSVSNRKQKGASFLKMLGQRLREDYLSESFVEIINQIKESMETIMQVHFGVGVFLFSAMELVHLIEVQNLSIIVV